MSRQSVSGISCEHRGRVNFFFLHLHGGFLRMKFRSAIILLFAAVVLIADGCASTHKHKKLKPGKPIPCPLKDC